MISKRQNSSSIINKKNKKSEANYSHLSIIFLRTLLAFTLNQLRVTVSFNYSATDRPITGPGK